ncbi:tomoregulin-2-like [Nymphalis io]|uniref:tomoregulin-2-like n=1 Tax=Inachis io TaxID=171585 RepID=UPI0021672FEF|nr:tomoregulin-2-like [Nymphalis io]
MKMLSIAIISILAAQAHCSQQPIVMCRTSDRLKVVCASNGKTYENICDFRQDKLMLDTSLEIKHLGKCELSSENNVRPKSGVKPRFDNHYDDYAEFNTKLSENIEGTLKSLHKYMDFKNSKKLKLKINLSKEIE